MIPLLSVYHEDRKRIGWNNSSHISLGNSSASRENDDFILCVFSAASRWLCIQITRLSIARQSGTRLIRPFFDSPDVESLH